MVYTHDPAEGELRLESTSFGGGRIVASQGPTGPLYTPRYHITDHLGSVRVVYEPLGNNRYNILGRSNYLPFGESWVWSWSQGIADRYLYNGKELQATGNLDYLDYGARMYDPRKGRWDGVDPLAGIHRDISPMRLLPITPSAT